MSSDRVEVEPMKTAAVEDRPTPPTVKDVRAFLRLLLLALYYQRYLPNFLNVATCHQERRQAHLR